MTRRRRWLFRAIALVLPLAVLGILEAAFRIAGAYGPEHEVNAHVEYVSGDIFFPEWAQNIATPSPDGVVRVFVLGGSTTMGMGSDVPFVDRLRQKLEARRPEVDWEVINGGMIAFGSHRVFEVMRESVAYDPDLYVVYTGQNEFLEEIFFDPKGLLARQEQIGRIARSLRVVNFARHILGTDGILPRTKIQRHFFGHSKFPLLRSDEQYRLRLEFLRSNLRQMVWLARSRGAGIILSPAVPNLLMEPGHSDHGDGYAADAGGFDDAYARGRAALGAGRVADAAEAFRSAHGIDDRFALSHFLLARAHLAAGDREEAKAEMLLANRLDRRGDRANPDIAEVIREVAAEEKVPLVDVWPEFLDRFADGAEDLFRDHCHPGDEGHERIAEALAEAVLKIY